ncbi:hypothetical protein QYE76_067234 [Lolium multiflorum]|uniref:Uncharacterized protein n=1 Tax=Lolium multiflorum TaxID=4521 RepID=A0AAD8WCS9_LOLMU|nr:hypothetical protein QYE76_067234 [Lolium multiflorum]
MVPPRAFAAPPLPSARFKRLPSAPASPSAAAMGGFPSTRFVSSPSLPRGLASLTQPVYTTTGEPPIPSLPAPPGGMHASMRRPMRTAPRRGYQPPRYTKSTCHLLMSDDPLNWLSQLSSSSAGSAPWRQIAPGLPPITSGRRPDLVLLPRARRGLVPPWGRFRELCLLRFGPPIRGIHLAELGRLPFTSTVQDFTDLFQELACHALGVTGQQRAELFVGGLPDHIRVDVELQAPHDLQTAMHYAREYERRPQALQPPPPSRGARRPAAPPPTAAPTTRPSPTTPAATRRTFRRLTPAEQLERRRLGLCFNCDE